MLNFQLAIEFKNIDFGYLPENQILKNISFQISQNKYVCIVGHNGSGKSTISKILIGLLKPWKGEVIIYGQKLHSKNFRFLYSKIGLIFQNPDNQFIGLTAEDDIAFGLENKKVPPEIIDKIIIEVAKTLNITHLLKLNAHCLSGGEKQKVAIASVLSMNPKTIIFDEATSMLDSISKQEIKQLMRHLVDESKKTVISITHDMEELLIADEIIVIKNGQILISGPANEVLKDPKFLESRLQLPFFLEFQNKLIQQGLNLKLSQDKKGFIEKLAKYLK